MLEKQREALTEFQQLFLEMKLADFLAPNFMGGNLVFSDVKDAGHKGQPASQARASSGPFRHAEGLAKGRSKQAFINVNVEKYR
jgi:hypothetical protein